MKERIYVAGPYSVYGCSLHDAPRLTYHNVNKAIEVGNALLLKGHDVFVPHLSYYQHIHPSMLKDLGERWYQIDNTFIDYWATAFFFIGSSIGTNAELMRAEDIELKIYYSLDEVPDA